MISTAIQNLKKSVNTKHILLDNGLAVNVLEMPDYKGIHAMFATDFGSAMGDFILDGKKWTMPAGVAHFLEHKMFEDENGQDAFSLYAQTGASANAYTGFDKTCYLFSATNNIKESLDILLDFVSKPYFTKETIAKEQGIIGQEIKMYDDNADWRITFSLLQCMYHNNPVKDDIAGTVESIAKITPELLYACCEAFYCPQNMTFCVAGNITLEEVVDAVNRADIKKVTSVCEKVKIDEPEDVKVKYQELNMPVAVPMLGISFKEKPIEYNVKNDHIYNILTDLIAGATTPLYKKLYNEGLVSGSVEGDYLYTNDYLNFIWCCTTKEPKIVEEMLRSEIRRLKEVGIDKEIFECARNASLGDMVTACESMDSMASAMVGAQFNHSSMTDEIEALASLTIDDINNTLRGILDDEKSSTVIINPVDEQEE